MKMNGELIKLHAKFHRARLIIKRSIYRLESAYGLDRKTVRSITIQKL